MTRPEAPGCYMYFFQHNGVDLCVDATFDRGNDGPGRLINHSRERPNLKTIKVVDNKGSPRLLFVAMIDIGKHEELSFDYGDRDPKSIEAFPWLENS